MARYRAEKLDELNARRRAAYELHAEEIRDESHARRVRFRAGIVAPVSVDAIYERDRGICQICRKPVPRKLASLDHILPIARGGTHEPRNVRITHRLCNIRRRHLGAAQLRLMG